MTSAAREERWARLSQEAWDLVVVGGGATGAAALREAARCGLKALLVEQRDYAWGTSSRSTKLAHGGLRYLDTGDLGLVRDSVRERDRLVRESGGLARALPFVLVTDRQEGRRRWKALAGVRAYTLLAGRGAGALLGGEELQARLPPLREGLGVEGSPYQEASLDDARLVLRLLREAEEAGATALNFARVESLLREGGRVAGVRLADQVGGRAAEVRAAAVVNATGVWADEVRGGGAGRPLQLRPLRGSHLLFPAWRLPLAQAVSFRHPRDRRFVCAVPWEDVTVVGTTDLDHREPLAQEPRASREEVGYLLEAAAFAFPALGLGAADVVSCFAGVRSVVDEGPGAPSQASRGHLVREEEGLVTVTGGKLTNCRQMAHDALRPLARALPALSRLDEPAPFFDRAEGPAPAGVRPEAWARLASRHGRRAHGLVAGAREGELEPVGGTQALWVEVREALRHEQVEHLDDLLLRRVRVGLALPEGAAAELPRVEDLCREELGWDAARWGQEEAAYRALWRACYAPPA